MCIYEYITRKPELPQISAGQTQQFYQTSTRNKYTCSKRVLLSSVPAR